MTINTLLCVAEVVYPPRADCRQRCPHIVVRAALERGPWRPGVAAAFRNSGGADPPGCGLFASNVPGRLQYAEGPPLPVGCSGCCPGCLYSGVLAFRQLHYSLRVPTSSEITHVRTRVEGSSQATASTVVQSREARAERKLSDAICEAC